MHESWSKGATDVGIVMSRAIYQDIVIVFKSSFKEAMKNNASLFDC